MKRHAYIIYSIIIFAITSIFINSNHTFAETFDANITIKPSLTLDISASKISMELNPSSKTYDEQDLTVSVGTNNSYGYKLYLTTNGTDLVNIADNTKTIATLLNDNGGEGYTIEELTPNYWGYRLTSNSTISSGNYFPFTNNLVISQSDGPVNNNTTTLGFASKIDYTKPSGTYELTLNFKALPIVTQTYMQNLDASLCTEDPTVVIDNRDNQTYTVQRLKDGKCWMMTNLNLGAYDLETDLTSVNTNLATTIPASEFNGWRNDGKPSSFSPGEFVTVSTTNSSNSLESDPVSRTKYGTIYNYCAATAGTICLATDDIDAVYDICPKNWRLPTGGSNSEFQILHSKYNSYEKMRASFYNTGAAFALAGAQALDESELSAQGILGQYWSSTRYIAGSSYVLRIDERTGNINTSHFYGGGSALTMRCILNEN